MKKESKPYNITSTSLPAEEAPIEHYAPHAPDGIVRVMRGLISDIRIISQTGNLPALVESEHYREALAFVNSYEQNVTDRANDLNEQLKALRP